MAKQHYLNLSACCLQNCLSLLACCNSGAVTLQLGQGLLQAQLQSRHVLIRKCRRVTGAVQHCLGGLACACSAIAVALQPGQALPVAALTPLGKCNTTNSSACNHQLYSLVWGFVLASCSIAGVTSLICRQLSVDLADRSAVGLEFDLATHSAVDFQLILQSVKQCSSAAQALCLNLLCMLPAAHA